MKFFNIMKDSPLNSFSLSTPKSTQIVFHAMNKSGSLSMSNALRSAFEYEKREKEFLSHYDLPCSQEEFISIVDSSTCHKIIIDHYLYGAIKPKPNRVMITQLRHPLQRILSCYSWIKLHPEISPNIVNQNLEQFIVETEGKGHCQVIQLGLNWSNKDWAEKAFKISARELYERSIEALDREIYKIGICEFFDESLFLFASLCNLKVVPLWEPDTRNTSVISYNDISSNERDLIYDVLRYDFLLYDYAKKKFWDQFIGINFGTSLKEYKNNTRNLYKNRIV